MFLKMDATTFVRKFHTSLLEKVSLNFAQYLTPYPNLYAITQNIKFFEKHHVKGLFSQGPYQDGISGEFCELRAYLISRLLWNSDADVKHDAQEFISAYYGGAAHYIAEYLKFIHEKGNMTHMGCAFTCRDKWDSLVNDDELRYLDKLWEDAVRACEKEKERIHTMRSSMCHEWFKLDSRRGKYSDPDKFESLQDDFYKKCRELGIQRLSEGVGVPNPQLT